MMKRGGGREEDGFFPSSCWAADSRRLQCFSKSRLVPFLDFELVSLILHGTEFWDRLNGILKHGTKLRLGEVAGGVDHVFMKTNLLFPVKEVGMVGAFPLAITQFAVGDMDQQVGGVDGSFGGAKSMGACLLYTSPSPRDA